MRLFFCCLVMLTGIAVFSQQAPSPNAAEMTSYESSPAFSSKVNLVLVPVVVRDRSGKAIGNLTKDDFRVFDKNKPQVIARFSVEATSHAATAHNPTNPTVATSESAGPTALGSDVPERYVAYVFDDLNTKFGDLARLQQAAKKHFAENLKATDRAAIFTTSGQNSLDFTGDRAKLQDALMRIHVNAMFGVEPNECPDISYYMADQIINKNDQNALQAETQEYIACASLDPSETTSAQQMVKSMCSRVLSISEQGTRISLGVLKDVVRRMGSMPGQRLVVILSPGFLTVNSESLQQKTDILDRAARENVVISALDVRGLYTDSTYDVSNRGSRTQQAAILKQQYDNISDMAQSDVLAELADGTGGTFFRNSNDLYGGLNRIAAAPEFVYLLGFTPENLKSDGSFHKLKVALVNDKGLSIQARRGYYAPKKSSNAEDTAKSEIEDAVFSREELHDIPVDLHTQFFKPDPADAKLTVLARVDLKQLRFRKADGRNNNNLTVVSVIFDRDGKYIGGMSKVIEMRLKDETLERLNSGITVRSNFDVKPGSYMIRLVVRDTEGQMMAATNGAVDIP